MTPEQKAKRKRAAEVRSMAMGNATKEFQLNVSQARKRRNEARADAVKQYDDSVK